MKEITFLNKNSLRWKNFESLLRVKQKTKPDHLADLYIQLTDDLAYSRTYYPKSAVTVYLNKLAGQTHQHIYKNKKIKKKQVLQFCKFDLPHVLFETRKYIYYSLLILLISSTIGWLSVIYDLSFIRSILGDGYVNQTIDNINKSDPMAIYKSGSSAQAFVYITPNNIFVAFKAFVFGVFTALGTSIILVYNGIMLGSFMAFFYKYKLFGVMMTTIWLHGTLEIFAIVMAGAAGILIGNSFIFPGTFSRAKSFKNAAKKSIKIIFGLIPIFIVAGFIESYITRITAMPLALRLFIIFVSLTFIIWYFFIYPSKLAHKDKLYDRKN